MASPSQAFQQRVHDALHGDSLPSEIRFGKFARNAGTDAVEQQGWRKLSSDQFWLLVQRLATARNITKFEFAGNKVGPRAFAVLTQVLGLQKGLTHIDLSDCDVRDAGCKHLAVALEAHCVVQFLGLSRNRIRRRGAKLLSRALKKCTTLEHIDLSQNNITPRGCMCIQQPLRMQTNLRHVNFSDCGFDDDSFFWMCDALATSKSLRHIDLSNNGIGPQEADICAKALRRQTWLQFLNLAGNKFGPAACIKFSASIKGGNSLLHFNLNGNMILDKGLAALSESLRSHGQLRFLGLGDNSITGVGGQLLMLTLPHLPLLSHLNLSSNVIDRKAAIGIAETLALTAPKLEFIDLSNNKMGGEGLFLISQSLGTRSQLRYINLRGNDANSSGCLHVVENVKMLSNLQSLLLDEAGELMSECVDSKAYVSKFPPPPPELVACKQWVELVRFLQNPSTSWKVLSDGSDSAADADDDSAVDSDVHVEDDADDSDSSSGGSSCEIESQDHDTSSSEDDSDDNWDDAVLDDSTSDSGKEPDGAGAVGSKRLLPQSQSQNSAKAAVVGIAAPSILVRNQHGGTIAASLTPEVDALGAAAPGSEYSASAMSKSSKRPHKSAIADIVGKGELSLQSVEYLRQLCIDSGLSSIGNKSSIIKRLQARFLAKYTKVFSEPS